jgi:hypothetical protein
MSPRVDKVHPAMKHGAYSAMGILPGESAAEFEKLHRELVTDLSPSGALENDIVASMARLLWRKKNLRTLKVAEFARERCSAIFRANVDPEFPVLLDFDRVDPVKREEQMRVAKDLAQKELGDIYDLIAAGEATTLDGLTKELDVLERLNAAIARCLKQLLLVRGVKSISEAPLSTSRPKRIAGPSKAA